MPQIVPNGILFAKNRRIPTQANHGARPCSSYMRKLKRKPYNSPRKESGVDEEEFNDLHHIHDQANREEKEQMQGK